MNFQKFLKIIGFCLVVLFFAGFFYYFTQDFSGSIQEFFVWKTTKNQQKMLASLQESILQENIPVRKWEIGELQVGASSAVALQIEKNGKYKILFEKNKNRNSAIASLTKLMTAAVVIDNYELSQKIDISKEAEKQGGFLKSGESFLVKDLLHSMLIESDNIAAFAFSEIIGQEKFLKLMNQKAEDFEMSDTFFVDATGIDPKNASTAEDLIRLSEKMLQNYPSIFEITSIPEFDLYDFDKKFHHKITNTNELLVNGSDFNEKIIGGKTGFTTEAKGCLLLIAKKNNIEGYLIYIILGSEERFGEMGKLIDWTNTAYKWQ